MNNNKIKDELRKKYFTAGLVIKKEEQQNIDIYNALKEAREQGAHEFSPSNSRNVSGKVKPRVIEVNANYNIIKLSESLKNNGYDENFKTELYRKKEWEKRDKQFNLVDKEENFTNAYRNSRLPTNSYIHFAEVENGKIETTGHVGGLFKEIDIKDKTPEEIRSESRKYVGKKMVVEIKMPEQKEVWNFTKEDKMLSMKYLTKQKIILNCRNLVQKNLI